MTRRTFLAAAAGTAFANAPFHRLRFQDFRTPNGPIGDSVGWQFKDGVLESRTADRRQCDLWTIEEYEHFDFEFDWKVAPDANSGVKYLVQGFDVDRLSDDKGPFVHETSVGFEFQLIDDASRVAIEHPTAVSGALYNYLPPTIHPVHRAGEWNTARLLVDRERIEHWINGKLVLGFSLDSPELKAALAARNSPSARMLERLARRKTPIALQHHQSVISFRRMRVRNLG
jgi:hypothetical protein